MIAVARHAAALGGDRQQAGVTPRENCFFLLDDCAGLCGQIAFNCHSYGDSCVDGSVVPLDSGAIIVDC
ncbi:MAG: hypothetical protein ABIP39_14320, partial [Polyangiaceae bacterium]